MNRPILIIVVGYIIGIILGLYFKTGIALIVFALFIKNVKNNIKILFILSIIISYIYCFWCQNNYEKKYKNILNLSGKALVISNVEYKDYYLKYIIKYNNTKLILKTKNNLEYGDLIRLEGEFKYPEAKRNYMGFDYREYLKTKNIYGIVESNNIKIIEKNKIDCISSFSNTIRQKIINVVNIVDEDETGNLLIGILLGDKDGLSEETETNFKNSGLAHLLAVSGLHVNYLILLIIFLLKKIRINNRILNIITILILIIFMYITNFTESVTRAVTMGIIILCGQVLYRKQDFLTSISFSLLIMLIENPYRLFSTGLQLSYAGTIGIVYLYPIFKEKVPDIVAVCISAQLFTFPIVLYNFNLFSTYFLLANILASPLVGIILISGIIFIMISVVSIKLSLIIYIPLKFLLKILIFINYCISNLPVSIILFKTPYLFNIIYYYIFFLLFFSKNIFKKLIYKKILVSIIIILLIFTFLLDLPKDFNLYFVDVGQGDCTLIKTNSNVNILIDGGGSENYNIGKNILLPYLLDRRINKLDYIIISHFDTDHVRWNINCYGEYKS